MNNYFFKIKVDSKETLFVRHQFMVEARVSENSLFNAKYYNRGGGWATEVDPEDKRCNLYNYDTMPEAYREKVQTWLSETTKGVFTCPYEYTALEPIRASITKDDKAEAWLTEYTYLLNGSPQTLSPEQIEQCSINAGILNMLMYYKGNKRECKKKFGIDWLQFVDQVISVIASQKYKYMPKTYRRIIVEILPKYEALGYEAILPPRLGNQNTAKVKDGDKSKDMILELLSHPNQYDDVFIAAAYNNWAKKWNLKTITSATVANKRIQYKFKITGSREGWNEHNKLFSRSISRTPPSQPLFLIEGDDNHIDWWFVDDKNNIKRLKAYVVVDSYKGVPYPLGWACSENDITEETVRLAFLMAMHHIKELTGGLYLPHETKTDRWGLKNLKPFYEGLGHYYPTPKGSKNRGWLETFFGHADWQRSLKTDPYALPAQNYTGHNIASKTMGYNQEALQEAYKQKRIPHINESGHWIAAHFERLRTLPIGYKEGAKSRQEQWLEGWAAMQETDKRPMSEMQFLMKVGLRHDANGGNAITKAGVQPTISGQQYSYAVPPAFFMQNIGRKVDTIYTPFDMSRVLITDNERLRFVAQHITPVAGCMADMQEGGRSFLNQIIAEKIADVNHITDAKKARRNRLQAAGMDSESVLKLGAAVPKELKTAAIEDYLHYEDVVKGKLITAGNDDYLEEDAASSI